MKKSVFSLFVAFSLLFAPVAQASSANCFDDRCHSVVSAQDDHHHDDELQADEHAQLDFDSEGNPHNGVSHNHSHHHHGSDFNPAYSGIDLATRIEGSTSLAYWKDNFYSDHCASPLLEPPSHA